MWAQFEHTVHRGSRGVRWLVTVHLLSESEKMNAGSRSTERAAPVRVCLYQLTNPSLEKPDRHPQIHLLGDSDPMNLIIQIYCDSK